MATRVTTSNKLALRSAFGTAANKTATKAATTPAATTPAATPAATTPAVTTPTPRPTVTSITGGDDLATALNKLVDQFNQVPEYQARTADQLRERASGEYQTYYDQLRLAAQQQQERSALALAQQRENIGRAYDDARQDSAEQYRQAYSQADRSMLNRGMQRSTYANQTLANLAQEGVEARGDLWKRQIQDQGQVDQQTSLLAQQLAAQLSQYDASQASDIMNRIRQLEDQDYERGVQNRQERNNLSSQIMEYLMKNRQFEEDKRQFDLNYQLQRMNALSSFAGGGSSGGGGGGGRSYSSGGGFIKPTVKATGGTSGAGAAPKATDSSVLNALNKYSVTYTGPKTKSAPIWTPDVKSGRISQN